MNKPYPKISIVTACYNHASYIGETIESIISQDYPNLEYIVIDDGSTDESWEVIKQYKSMLAVCERLEGNRPTPVIALNYGFQKTSGEIMMWLNSDDILLPKSLFVIAQIHQEHPEIEWLTGMATTINGRSELINSKLRLKHVYDYLIDDWKVIQQESTSWRRTLWEKTGSTLNGNGYARSGWAFDTELWTRFFLHTIHYHVAAPIGAFRTSKQSKSVTNEKIFLEPNCFYLQQFRAKMQIRNLLLAFIYRFCKFCKPLIGLIPTIFILHIPILNKFTYRVLIYDRLADSWNVKQLNPFRQTMDL